MESAQPVFVFADPVYEHMRQHVDLVCVRENKPDRMLRVQQILTILHQLGVDAETQLATILHCHSPLSGDELEAIRTLVPETTIKLYQGVDQVQQLSQQILHHETGKVVSHKVNDENLRRMLITLVDDVRVVLIKLADHLNQLRQAKDLDEEKQQQLGQLTLDIYAPLANRLGIWQIKWEIEDFALRYLHPDAYKNIAEKVDEKRLVREQYINSYITSLHGLISHAGIYCEVYGRPKHLYSIWKKMRGKGLLYENLFDLRAVRILVNSISDCYSALGIVHTNWRHIPGEFDDYIATPKPNGYRSIHTVIIGPEDKSVEVQIRTFDMHHENELGVAAHWRYKENHHHDYSIDNKVLWLRQLLEWKEELLDNQYDDAQAEIERQLEDQRVFVLTPKGTVIDLPAKSTPIDFAYAIHTEVGNRIRGARVNGKMTGLDYQLQSGDQVEVLTTKEGGPSRDWLRDDLGYIRTAKARNRIAHWFKQKDQGQHISAGRAMLEKELHRLGLDDIAYEKITQASPYNKIDDLLAALGAGDFKLSKALLPFKRQISLNEEPELLVAPKTLNRKPKADMQILGVDNLMTQFAKCCNPIPGDEIIGYISIGRGVMIHRLNCNNIQNLDDDQRNRLVEVSWGEQESQSYVVDVVVRAYQRNNLLHNVTEVLKQNNVNVLSVKMNVDNEQIAYIELRLGISGLSRLSKITANLSSIQNVLSVQRQSQ